MAKKKPKRNAKPAGEGIFVNPIPVIADPDDLYQSRFVQTVSVVSIGRKGWLKFSFTRISII